MNTGSLKIDNEYFYEYKDICESDSFCPLCECDEQISEDKRWVLSFAPNIEINVNKNHKIKNPPKYFIFFAKYIDNTYDIIRFDIKEPKYIIGYNESRKFYNEELDWVIKKLNNKRIWEYFIDNYNEIFHYNDNIIEHWETPNYLKIKFSEHRSK